MRSTTEDLEVTRDPPSIKKHAPFFAMALVTVGVETFFSAMLASYRSVPGIKAAAAACLIANLFISSYFIMQARRLNTQVLSVLSVRLPGTGAHLRRMLAWLAVSGWCTVLYTCGTALFIARGETIFWWHFSLAICGLGRVLMSFAQVRSLDPPLEDSEQPAPGETDASGDAAYGDDEQPTQDEAAFQPLQIPIKELLFRIVHGKDVKAAAGDFELSVRSSNALDSVMFLHTPPAPALILDERARS